MAETQAETQTDQTDAVEDAALEAALAEAASEVSDGDADDIMVEAEPSDLTSPDLTSPDRFLLAALPPAPIQPGSPSSPYRRCSCIGTPPGRSCPRCNGLRWTKLCGVCAGDGLVSAPTRAGATFQRKDRCGYCMGRGSTPVKKQEIDLAEAAWAEFVADGGKPRHAFEDDRGRILRGAKLPTPKSGKRQGQGQASQAGPASPRAASK